MDNGKQIAAYLEELAHVLLDLQVKIPFHILIAGGAFLLLQKKRRSTEDIDFALIENPPLVTHPDTIFRITIKNGEISRNAVPHAEEFRHAVAIVSRRHKNLPEDWLNDEAASYYYDDAPQAEVIFWRSFHGLIHCYLPTLEYMFATKIAAYRQKDEKDIHMLIKDLNIEEKQQAKQIIDKFLLADSQVFWEVEEKLDELFD